MIDWVRIKYREIDRERERVREREGGEGEEGRERGGVHNKRE